MSERFYFQCKIRFERIFEGGNTKKVTEDYLIDGEDFAIAYNRFIEEMKPLIKNSAFEVTSMIKIKLSDIIDIDKEADCWFKLQRSYKIANEKSGKEQIIKEVLLVHSMSLREAIKEIMHRSTEGVDYVYKKLEETPISDVFIHNT